MAQRLIRAGPTARFSTQIEGNSGQMDIDPRGPRFGALITMVVFAVVLITGNVWLLAAQAVVFAVRARSLGLRYVPVRAALPLAGQAEAWPARRARGRGAAAVRPGGRPGHQHYRHHRLRSRPRPLGMVAAGLGLVAAVLNGVFGLCLGCEMYLMIRRTWPRASRAGRSPALTRLSKLHD